MGTMLCPCHTVGKVAEGLGESYCYSCLCALVPIVDIIIVVSQRGKVRARQGIAGGVCGDLLYTLCCPICTICQLGNEVEGMKNTSMAIDLQNMDICRQ